MKQQMTLTLLVGLVVCPLPGLHGELFLLHNGGTVEGQWLNASDEPVGEYQIETLTGVRLTLSVDQVKEVVVKSDLLRRYEEFLPRIADSVEGHWDMAARCQKAGLKPQREFHLRKVLQFDPNHESARHALGYSRVKGEWIKADQWLKKQGYIRHKGAWRLAQEIELEASRDQRTDDERQWRTRLRRWHNSIVRGRGDPGTALAEIQRINKVRAVPGLAAMLDEDDTPRQLVLVYVDVIGRFNSSQAAGALIRRVLKDSDPETLERCVEILKQRGLQQAIAVMIKTLGDKNNSLVNRAAWVLGELGSAHAIPALIDALTTEHRFVVGGGGGSMNAGFSPTGGDSFSTGGGLQVVRRGIPNERVLGALVALTPDGINFSYNKQAWKNWYAQTKIPAVVNLRRD